MTSPVSPLPFVSITQLAESSAKECFCIALWMIGDRTLAAEVAGSACKTAVEQMGSRETLTTFSNDAACAAVQHTLSMLKHDQHASRTWKLVEIGENQLSTNCALQALPKLQLQYRLLLVLRDLLGMSRRRIQHVVDLPLATLESQLMRARLNLRRTIAAMETKIAEKPGF